MKLWYNIVIATKHRVHSLAYNSRGLWFESLSRATFFCLANQAISSNIFSVSDSNFGESGSQLESRPWVNYQSSDKHEYLTWRPVHYLIPLSQATGGVGLSVQLIIINRVKRSSRDQRFDKNCDKNCEL